MLGLEGGLRRVAVEALPKLGRDQAEPPSAAAELPLEPLPVAPAAELVDDPAPGPEGRRAAALPAVPPDDPHVLGLSPLGQGADERGLADPGLAGHQRETTTAGSGRTERRAQLLELALTTHEMRPRRSGGSASPTWPVLSAAHGCETAIHYMSAGRALTIAAASDAVTQRGSARRRSSCRLAEPRLSGFAGQATLAWATF